MLAIGARVQRAIDRLERAVGRKQNAECDLLHRLHVVHDARRLCFECVEWQRKFDVHLIADNRADCVFSRVDRTTNIGVATRDAFRECKPGVDPIFVVEQKKNFKLK